MDKWGKQRLLWTIDFVNVDIDRLAPGDFLKALVEMEENFSQVVSAPPKNTSPPHDAPEARERAKSIQRRVRGILERIFEAGKGQKYLGILEPHAPAIVTSGEGTITVGLPRRNWEDKDVLEFAIADLLFRQSPKLDKYGRVGKLMLKKCRAKGCTNLFIQLGKKGKNYCSNRCAWRAYSDFRREEERKDKAKGKVGK